MDWATWLKFAPFATKKLRSFIEKSFRPEDIETVLLKKTNFDPIIESYYDEIEDSLDEDTINAIGLESIYNFFKMTDLKNIIRIICDPLDHCDTYNTYSKFEDLVSQYFKLESYKIITFAEILFEILIEGCNETLTTLNNDGNISSQNVLDNYRKFIEQYGKIKELREYLRKYKKDSDYLPRKVKKADNLNLDNYLFLDDRDLENILQVIITNKHIVLLSDPGVGKTTELKQLAYHYSKYCPYFPILVNLNKYTNNKVTEYFPKYWELIPEEKLIVLLDGLDEVERKNVNYATSEIELFVDKHPNVCIVVSCRTNFYKIEAEDNLSMSTLSGFTSYVLLDLGSKEIEKYTKDKLEFKSTSFFKDINGKKIYPLLRSPFYLVNLVELFEKNNSLPKSKAEIFENLLELRLKLDIKHYHKTKELENEKKNVMKNLEYVALAMECLGRNYIDNDELEEILPESSSREILEYCTTWIKQETDKVTWQFEHNNFQEYLAAKKLANYPLEVIKDLVSSDHEHKEIALSWINTLSFLICIYDTDDLQKWILSVQPELFVNFEYTKISRTERIRIFKEIFESYEERKIWINRAKFRYDEIARFGQSDEIVDYLLNKIEKSTYYTTVGMSIELLWEFEDIPIKYRDKAKKLLIKCALTSKEGIVQNRALSCLSIHGFDSKEVIDQVVPSLRRSKDDNIRSSLYFLIYNSDCLNDYINIFIEGLDCAFSREIFSTSELVYLEEGFNKADSPESIRKIVQFFKNEPKYFEKLYFMREIGFLDNATQAYKKDPSILESCIELYKSLLIGREEQAQKFLSFFDDTNSRLQVFQKIYLERNVEKFSFLILAALANMDCIKFYIEEYEDGKITDADIRRLQSSLALQNSELYLQFNKIIVEKYGDKFSLPPKKDPGEKRAQEVQRDIELIFNKDLFLNEIHKIFEISKKEELTHSEILKIELENFEENISKLIIQLLYKIADGKTVTLKEATEYINGLDWELFIIRNIYNMFTRNESINLSQEQIQHISEWCISHVKEIDFRTAIYKKDKKVHTNIKAIYLWYFLRELKLSYPKNILLDMISFDFNLGTNFVGIEYLERLLLPKDMKIRVLDNLNKGIECDFILKNHIIFCKNHRITQVLPFTPDIIKDANRTGSTRKLALDITTEMSEDLNKLEVILTEIKDNFKWVVLETLIGNNKNCETFLLNTYNTGNENDKLKAFAYLMKCQNIKGLEFFIEWIKEKEKYPWFIGESPLRFLHDFIFVPDLLKLLKMSYQENISQDDFHSLHNDVLEALSRIAMNSIQNFSKIKKCIEEFITENSSSIKDIHFLYSYLERLELEFGETTINKNTNYVIAKFRELDITVN